MPSFDMGHFPSSHYVKVLLGIIFCLAVYMWVAQPRDRHVNMVVAESHIGPHVLLSPILGQCQVESCVVDVCRGNVRLPVANIGDTCEAVQRGTKLKLMRIDPTELFPITAAEVTSMAQAPPLQLVDFEVFGQVQGVYFRKFTRKQAVKVGVSGWVRNTDEGTVVGQLEGTEDKVDKMKHWLQKVGSPMSKIREARFGRVEAVPVDRPTFKEFVIGE